MNSKSLMEKLKGEGFAHVYEWHDEPGTSYPEHAHKGKVAVYVIRGSVAFSGDIDQVLGAGDRLDIVPEAKHSAAVGSEGCDWVVGEEIERDS